jgi:hypothetical protein
MWVYGETMTCSVGGCDKPSRRSLGMCIAHYSRVRRHGSPGSPEILSRKARPSRRNTCSIEGCEEPCHGRELCSSHYWRWLNHGSPGDAEFRTRGGDGVGYIGVHLRVSALRGVASAHMCQRCDKPAAHWAYDHLDPNEKIVTHHRRQVPISLDPDHYMPLCARCHKRFDMAFRKASAVS